MPLSTSIHKVLVFISFWVKKKEGRGTYLCISSESGSPAAATSAAFVALVFLLGCWNSQ